MIKIYYSSIYFKSIANGLKWVIQRYLKTIITNYNQDQDKIQVQDSISIIESKSKTNETIWIILGLQNAHIMPQTQKYIVWNFEQFEVNGLEFNQLFWDKMGLADQIWDYSLENIRWLNINKSLDAYHLPLGWMPQMKIPNQISSWVNRVNTFAFVGLMNDRRRDILKPCYELAKNKSWNMYLSNKCWDTEYNTIYSMTKYGLNIHYYTGKTILEVHRIIPLILNEIWIISEKSSDPWYNQLFDQLVTWAEPDTFSQLLEKLEQMSYIQVEEELGRRKRLLIQSCDMYKFFIDSEFKKIDFLSSCSHI